MTQPAVQQAQSGMNSQPVFNATQPKQPQAVPQNFDFSIQSSYNIDLSILNAFTTIDFVQTMYFDNSAGNAPIIAFNGSSNQTIYVPPGSQAYVPVLSPNPAKWTFTSSGGQKAQVQFLNFPVAPEFWSVSGPPAFAFNGGGDLLVSDPALEALISAGGLNVNVISSAASGNAPLPLSHNYAPANGTVLYTPALGLTGVLASLRIYATPEMYLTGGGILFCWITSGAQTIIETSVELPGATAVAAAPTGPALLYEYIGPGIKGLTTNNAFTWHLPTPPTGGSFVVDAQFEDV